MYQLLAGIVLTIHVVFVAFVMIGLVAILIGAAMRQSWARNPVLRVAHLGATAFVVMRAWMGIPCPLTHFELYLREQARMTYDQELDVFTRVCHRLVFRDDDLHRFRINSTLWLAAVSLVMALIPPRNALHRQGSPNGPPISSVAEKMPLRKK